MTLRARLAAHLFLFLPIIALHANRSSGATLIGGGYGGGYGSKRLYSIDIVTGYRTPLHRDFNGSGFGGFNGLAFNTRDQHLYATEVDFRAPPRHPPGAYVSRRIFRIDPSDFTIETYSIGGYIPTSTLDQLDGLEYDSRRNVFWATLPYSAELLRIDADTFQATVVGHFAGREIVSGLAYDRVTDTLYGVEDHASGSSPDAQSQLERIPKPLGAS